MAINLSGQAIQDVRVAGVQAQRVMLGTGSTAVEVWSLGPAPIGGSWSGSTASPYMIFQYVVDKAATLQIEVTGTGNYGYQGYVLVSLGDGSWGAYGNVVQGSGTSTLTTTRSFAAGDEIYLAAISSLNDGSTVSGTWSITNI